MKPTFSARAGLLGVLATILFSLAPVNATIVSVTVFARGASVGSTNPDSICQGQNSIWVAYTNNSVSTGGGLSTIVQYDLQGNVLQTVKLAGGVDGLKNGPNGLIWALQNQDGNSALTLINPQTGILPGSPLHYVVTSTSRGYDDVAFLGSEVFLTYTNPAGPEDYIVQNITSIGPPITVSGILQDGASAMNIATGQTQTIPATDPDSLKITPDGELVQTEESPATLVFIKNPGAANQTVSFLNLIDSTGAAVSSLDDPVFATSSSGTFYVSDTSNNRILAIKATNLSVNSLYASVGSLNAFVSVNRKTGVVKPLVENLNGPHGNLFLPQ
jgi:hypothetical protein